MAHYCDQSTPQNCVVPYSHYGPAPARMVLLSLNHPTNKTITKLRIDVTYNSEQHGLLPESNHLTQNTWSNLVKKKSDWPFIHRMSCIVAAKY
jgi:hypothetical protein